MKELTTFSKKQQPAESIATQAVDSRSVEKCNDIRVNGSKVQKKEWQTLIPQETRCTQTGREQLWESENGRKKAWDTVRSLFSAVTQEAGAKPPKGGSPVVNARGI